MRTISLCAGRLRWAGILTCAPPVASRGQPTTRAETGIVQNARRSGRLDGSRLVCSAFCPFTIFTSSSPCPVSCTVSPSITEPRFSNCCSNRPPRPPWPWPPTRSGLTRTPSRASPPCCIPGRANCGSIRTFTVSLPAAGWRATRATGSRPRAISYSLSMFWAPSFAASSWPAYSNFSTTANCTTKPTTAPPAPV